MIPVDTSDFARVKPTVLTKSKWVKLALEEFSVTNPQTKKTVGPAMREFIVCRQAVALIIYCPYKKKILMSRQFRMPVMFNTKDAEKGWIYEAVAGLVDDGENPIQTAIREAKEETGVIVRPDQLSYIGGFYTSPGISTEKIFVFTAQVDDTVPEFPSGGLANEAEAIVSVWLTYDEVKVLLATEQIQDFKTYTALKSIAGLEFCHGACYLCPDCLADRE